MPNSFIDYSSIMFCVGGYVWVCWGWSSCRIYVLVLFFILKYNYKKKNYHFFCFVFLQLNLVMLYNLSKTEILHHYHLGANFWIVNLALDILITFIEYTSVFYNPENQISGVNWVNWHFLAVCLHFLTCIEYLITSNIAFVPCYKSCMYVCVGVRDT